MLRWKIDNLIDKYLSNFKCSNEIKIGACIFHVLSLDHIPYQLNRITGLLCSNLKDTEKLFKIVQIFPQQNTVSNNITTLADFLFCQVNFSKDDRSNISKLLDKYSCKFCSFSPTTQIAGISYWYFKNCLKKKRSLKILCESFFISQNSVHLYLNHHCVKKGIWEWMLFYRTIRVLYCKRVEVLGYF